MPSTDGIEAWLENYGDEIIAAAIIFALVWIVYAVCSRGLAIVQRRRRLAEPIVFVIRKLMRWVTVLVSMVLVLQALGVLQNAWAGLTAILAMIAIGFVAVWSVLSNTLCSVILLIARPFQIGDTIEVTPDNLKGKVVNFTLLFTTLEDLDGNGQIQVPNNLFFQRVIRRTPGQKRIALDEQLMVEEDAQV